MSISRYEHGARRAHDAIMAPRNTAAEAVASSLKRLKALLAHHFAVQTVHLQLATTLLVTHRQRANGAPRLYYCERLRSRVLPAV
jgi:hypothetical protein